MAIAPMWPAGGLLGNKEDLVQSPEQGTNLKAPEDMMRRTLAHGDLTLRPLVARDAGELFMLVEQHRAVLRRYMNWVDRTTAAADVNYYILTLDGFWKAGLTYGILLEEALVGTVGYHHADLRNDRVEIGYWLAPPYHGRGLASRAVDLALDAAFQYTSVNRIDAKVHPENKASIRLLEKLGFVYEGLERGGIKFGNEYRDHRIYSLLRGDASN